ncbi:MAG: SurA N-terminal domain-containing protein [Thermodesulfobacteriota bacterium]
MLEVMRKKSKSYVVVLIFGVIILVFVFWGVGPMGGNSTRAVAVVDGEEVLVDEYSQLYNRQLDYLRQSMGDQFSEEALENMRLKDRTINIIINNKLIVKAADKDGVKVADSEVQQAILKIPAFQKDGAYNKERYLLVLSQNRMKPGEFERGIKQDLIVEKMKVRKVSDLTVTDDEAWERYAKDNKEMSFEYLKVDPENVAKKIEVGAEEAKKHFDENSFFFKKPTEVKAVFAKAGAGDFAALVKITEVDMKGYYESHEADYLTPREVSARHILIRTKGEGDAEAQGRAAAILARLKKGEDFATLAKKLSEDTGSGAKGGDLGFFVRSRMVKPFADAAFSLEKGAMSELVESRFGFHIIRVDDIRAEGVKTFGEVKRVIEAQLAGEQAAFLARDKMTGAIKIFEETADPVELAKLLNKDGLKLETTGFFTEGDTTGPLSKDQALKNAVFGLIAGGVSAPVETKDGIYIIKVTELIEEHIPPFEDVSGRAGRSLIAEMAVERAKEDTKALINDLKEGKITLKEIKAKGKVAVKETDYTTKLKGTIVEISLNRRSAPGLFDLTMEEPFYGEPIPHNKFFYLFKLKAVKDAKRSDFDKIKDILIENIKTKKQDEVMTEWVTGLREKAEVTINENLL